MARGDEDEREDRRRTSHIDAPLGRRLRTLRELQGLTQQEVADRLGISSIQWGRYESGESRIPAARLHQICVQLGLSVVEVFESLPHQVVTRAEAGPPGLREPAAPDFDGPPLDPTVRRIGALVRELPPERRKTALAVVKALRDEARNPPDEN